MFARFRGPAPNPNLNAAKAKLTQNISNYARAVNAHKRAVASPNNKTPEQISNLNKAARNKRALAMESLNAYLNKVIQVNVNKMQTAQSEKAVATAAANATLAARVLDAVKKAGVSNPNTPSQANVNKLRTVINKVSRGGFGSRMIGTTRITNNMVQPLKNKLANMISKLGKTEAAAAEAASALNRYNKTNRKTNNGKNIYVHMTRNSSAGPFGPAGNGNYIMNANGKFIALTAPVNMNKVNQAAKLLYKRANYGFGGMGAFRWKANTEAGRAVQEMANIGSLNKNAIRAALNNASRFGNRTRSNRAAQILNKIGAQ